MLVKMIGDGQTYNGHYKDGDVVDLTLSVAMALIRSGKAEDTEEQPTEKRLETLENRKGRVMEVPSVSTVAGARDLSSSARKVQTAREPNELLTRMRADASNTIEDDSDTGALRKAFDTQQERVAAEYDSDEEPNIVDLNKMARDAALQDAKDTAARNKSTAESNTAPEDTTASTNKPATDKPNSGARAPRS